MSKKVNLINDELMVEIVRTCLCLWASPELYMKSYNYYIWYTNPRYFKKHRVIPKCNRILKPYLEKEADIKIVNLTAQEWQENNFINPVCIEDTTIILPPMSAFKTSEWYHYTKFHEVLHTVIGRYFDRMSEARDELIVRCGACILAVQTGILDFSMLRREVVGIAECSMYYSRQPINFEKCINKICRAFRDAEQAVDCILDV